MRVLVTGNLGYIGVVLVPIFQARGHEVVGLDSDLYRRCTFGKGPLPKVRTIIKDIRDVTLDDVRGFEAVVHLAGLSNDPLGNLEPDLTFDINHRASVRLAELAKQAGVRRFAFSSSCSNYGAGGEDLLTEESPFNPVTPYGKSKVLVERDVSAMASDSFSPIFLRNATAYGVSPRIRFDLVLNNLVAWAFTTGQVYLKSDGSAWRPIVHIQDIAQAFLGLLEAPLELVHNQAFNVVRANENYRIKELAEIVARTVPGCALKFADGASPDLRCYRVNCDKIRRVLGDGAFQWTASAGAEELHASYRGNPFTLKDFEGHVYQRVSHIRKLLEEKVLDKTLRFSA
ncbi:MAG: NAD-dependent epimerase/dehydratase family protein [Phycisphaerae bacterium]